MRKGFTLIELLVAVIVAAVLAGIVLVVIDPSAARKKARDAIRVNDLKSIQSALEVYFADNGAYPPSGPSGVGRCSPAATLRWEKVNPGSCMSVFLSGSSPAYLKLVPSDPSDTSRYSNSPESPCTGDNITYRYNYVSTPVTASEYMLTALMESNASVTGHECVNAPNWAEWAGCGKTFINCYAVFNP